MILVKFSKIETIFLNSFVSVANRTKRAMILSSIKKYKLKVLRYHNEKGSLI